MEKACNIKRKLFRINSEKGVAIYPGRVYTYAVRINTPWGFDKGRKEVYRMAENDHICIGCSHKKKERSEKEYKDLLNRLSRIEGQVRGIRRMVENNAYCTDILIQVSAVNAALNSFNKVLLANHIRTCVADDIRSGKEETIDELVATLQKLMK